MAASSAGGLVAGSAAAYGAQSNADQNSAKAGSNNPQRRYPEAFPIRADTALPSSRAKLNATRFSPRHCSANLRAKRNEGGTTAALGSAARRELLVDRARRRGAGRLILRAGAAGAADGADDLAAFDQRNAAARSDDVVKREDVIEAELLHDILERLGRAAVARRDSRLVLGDRNRGELGAVHAAKGDQIAVGIDHRDVHRPAALGGLVDRRLNQRLCAVHGDRGAKRNIERHFVGNGIQVGRRSRGRRRRLLLSKSLTCGKQAGRQRQYSQSTRSHLGLLPYQRRLFGRCRDLRRKKAARASEVRAIDR